MADRKRGRRTKHMSKAKPDPIANPLIWCDKKRKTE